MRFRLLLLCALSAAVVLPACGDGEDRPGQVTSEGKAGSGTGTGSASHSGSASHTGSGSGTGVTTAGSTGTAASGDHAHEETKPAFAKSAATDTVEVELREYSFVGMPASVTGPKAYFSLVNKGEKEHEFEVIDADGKAVAEVAPFAAGQSKTLAVELQPATYTVQCLVDEGGRTHAELGMKTTFVVT